MTLREFVEQASAKVGLMFKHQGRIHPMFHIVRDDGRETAFLAPFADDRDKMSAAVRNFFAATGVRRCLFIDEAWIMEESDPDRAKQLKEYMKENSLEHMPGRKEVVVLAAEDENEGQILGHREIIRPKKGKAKLGPLDIKDFDQSEGRMVGLLPRKGRAN